MLKKNYRSYLNRKLRPYREQVLCKASPLIYVLKVLYFTWWFLASSIVLKDSRFLLLFVSGFILIE